jgi:predicted dithiol-disulfide oxidoreductase (DUF899 family)
MSQPSARTCHPAAQYALCSPRPTKQRKRWTVPFYSSRGTTFSDDCGAGGGFGLSVFLRDGDDVYRTYFTNGRGVDRLRFDMNVFDLTALGRQEEWEELPGGWPRTEAHFAVTQKDRPDEHA